MDINNYEGSIIEEAIKGLGEIGLDLKGPETLFKEARKESSQKKKQEKEALATNLDRVLNELTDKSNGCVIHHEDKLYMVDSHVWPMLALGKRNAIGQPRPGKIIGGISQTLFENRHELSSFLNKDGEQISIIEGRPATREQFQMIVESIKKYVEAGVITGTSIPCMVRDFELKSNYSHFELTKILYESLPGIPIKTWLHEESDQILREVASWPLVYDSYCPPVDVLTFSPSGFWDMMRSVKAGNDMGITSMPRSPMWGTSPRLCLTTAMMEMIGLLTCCLTLNSNVKTMMGQVCVTDRVLP